MPFYSVLWHIVARCEAKSPHGASQHAFQGPQGHITARCEFRVAVLPVQCGYFGLLFCRYWDLFLPDVDDFADVHIVDAEAGVFVPGALFSGHQ